MPDLAGGQKGAGTFPEESAAPFHDSVFSGSFYFDPADPIYADHFPGCPVVPGSVIISAFLEAGQTVRPGLRPQGVQNFKFRTFLPPGEYPFRLEIQEDRLQCRLWQQETGNRRPLVTGTILCQPAK
jgi:3-hydroxyacyl-[acyl-carrier-protein] dehydratase